MKFKDENPIFFEITQTDMEKIQYNFNQILEKGVLDKNLYIKLKNIYNFFEHKIGQHKERGDWI